MPVELLIIIFKEVVIFYVRGAQRRKFVEDIAPSPVEQPNLWFRVAHVCQHWRSIVLGCPQLFSFIRVKDSPWTSRILSYTGSVPLHLEGVWSDGFSPQWSPFTDDGHIRRAISLKIVCTDHSMILGNSDLPMLRHIWIVYSQQYGLGPDASQIRDLICRAPELQMVTVEAPSPLSRPLDIDRVLPQLPNSITHFHFHWQMHTPQDISAFAIKLINLPCLIVLELTMYCTPLPPDTELPLVRMAEVNFASLRHLIVRSCHLWSTFLMLGCISPNKNTTLEVETQWSNDSKDGHPKILYQLISELYRVQMSRIRSVCIRFTTPWFIIQHPYDVESHALCFQGLEHSDSSTEEFEGHGGLHSPIIQLSVISSELDIRFNRMALGEKLLLSLEDLETVVIFNEVQGRYGPKLVEADIFYLNLKQVKNLQTFRLHSKFHHYPHLVQSLHNLPGQVKTFHVVTDTVLQKKMVEEIQKQLKGRIAHFQRGIPHLILEWKNLSAPQDLQTLQTYCEATEERFAILEQLVDRIELIGPTWNYY